MDAFCSSLFLPFVRAFRWASRPRPRRIRLNPRTKEYSGSSPTSGLPRVYIPISHSLLEEKFKIATEDSFDRGTAALAVLFAGEAQLTNATPAFGQGVKGYARYLGTSYADFVIGDMMTEAIYPVILHQDPRYFRRGTGSVWSRLGSAAGQIFWTHTDSDHTQFNFSEIIGNSTAVAISIAYYPDNRTATNAVSKLGVQLGVDMASNILKEFWPDINRKFSRKHRAGKDETP